MADTPLYTALKAYTAKRRISFHTPGHKGQASLLDDVFSASLDLTELPQTGSLYDGGDAIEQAELCAAQTFGAAMTAFSAGGCTLCIQAMLALAAQHGASHVLMARNAHRSALQAAALLDLRVDWLTDLSPCAVEAALQAAPSIGAVYLTSPDYYGRLADIAALSAVCKRHGAALLVDNAHGTHLGAFGLHPLALGADMTADSAHKTLPVLTGGAMLHIAENGRFSSLSRRQVKQAMALFGSTSPAFPILASLDVAQAWWRCEGEAAFAALRERLLPVRQAVSAAGLAPAFDGDVDPVRVTLDLGDRDAPSAAAYLREAGIEPEYVDSRFVVLLASPFHTDADLRTLEDAMRGLCTKSLPKATPSPFSAGMPQQLPTAVMSLRDAMRGACEEIAMEDAVGRVASGAVCPCPPGVAAVAPGELLTEEMTKRLLLAGFDRISVVTNRKD